MKPRQKEKNGPTQCHYKAKLCISGVKIFQKLNFSYTRWLHNNILFSCCKIQMCHQSPKEIFNTETEIVVLMSLKLWFRYQSVIKPKTTQCHYSNRRRLGTVGWGLMCCCIMMIIIVTYCQLLQQIKKIEFVLHGIICKVLDF